MGNRPLKPLWPCPKCGARLVTPNMWHSCGLFSEDALFVTASPDVRQTFEALRSAVLRQTDAVVTPQKTRIVFQLRTRFLSVYPRKASLIAGFVFRQSSPGPRFHRIEGPISGAFVHYVRLTSPAEVDDEIAGFIRQAIPYGEQTAP